ncbi:MAG: rhodanese-like domain-containing protein [Bacteroidota bacterium]
MKLVSFLFVVFSFVSASAQVQSSAFALTLQTLLSHSVPELSVRQVEDLEDYLLLDARESEEYQVSHIAKAKHVGYDEFDIKELDHVRKNERIVVYCSVGYRSEKIGEKLKKAGFAEVSNLYGGIFEWVNQGQPVVDKDGRPTENIHAYSKTWGIWLTRGNKVYDSK